MKRIVFFLILLELAITCHSASNWGILDMKSQSLGGLRALSETSYNPAYWSFRDKTQVGFATQNHFQVKELNTLSGYVLLPNPWLDMGVSVAELGYTDYQQWMIHAGFSKKIHSQVAIGATLRYQSQTGLYDENVQPIIGLDLAMNVQLSPQIRGAILYENIAHNTTNAQLPTGMLSAGIDYTPLPPCHLFIESASNFRDVLRLTLGIDYELMDKFCVRAGCHTQELTPTFGVSFTWNSLTADVACDRHANLGYSVGMGISYQF